MYLTLEIPLFILTNITPEEVSIGIPYPYKGRFTLGNKI